MVYRKLGNTDMNVSVLGFGGWGIGGDAWVGANDEDSIRSIRQSMEHGVNLFDSALGYGGGHSEELIGQVVKGQQDKYYVTSKIPPKNYTWPQKPGTPIEEAYPADWIVECTEKSLKNFGLDYIDLQQFHVWINEWSEIDSWKEAVAKLIKDGKVRYFGLSINFPYGSIDDGIPTMENNSVDSIQVVHNIFQQEPEKDVFVSAAKNNKGIICRCPLDEGALSGKITPDSTFPEGSFLEGYFKGDRKQEVFEKTQALNWLIEEGFAENLPEAAIRYCLSFPVVSSVIVGMRSPKHTEANCKAADKGPLPQEALDRLKAHAWDHNYWE